MGNQARDGHGRFAATRLFDWGEFARSVFSRSCRFCVFAVGGLAAVDFVFQRVGLPSMSAQAPLTPIFLVLLLTFILLVAALAEALDRLHGLPVSVPIGRHHVPFNKSIVPYVILVVGISAIYFSPRLLPTEKVVVTVAAPSPEPLPSILVMDLIPSVRGIDGPPSSPFQSFLKDVPEVSFDYRNATGSDEKYFIVGRADYNIAYHNQRGWDRIRNLRAIVASYVVNNDGKKDLPPNFIERGTFRMDNVVRLNAQQKARYIAGMDGIYFVIDFVSIRGNQISLAEECGIKVVYSPWWPCPPK